MSQELKPPHRKYFRHADAVYPPAFVAVLAAICYWRLVPPLAILILLLPLFLIGLQCFIVEGEAPFHPWLYLPTLQFSHLLFVPCALLGHPHPPLSQFLIGLQCFTEEGEAPRILSWA